MKIITLVENNSADSRLKEEFGLSILIQCDSGTILFDMGASAQFAKNAVILGVDLTKVDCGVVSHAHYDHGGGLQTFLQLNTAAMVYVGKNFDGQYFSSARIPYFLEPLLYPMVARKTAFSKYIGIDRAVFTHHSDRLITIEDTQEILQNVFLLTNINVFHPRADGNKYLLEKDAEGLRCDSFSHELIMVIREADGLVLFTGCGHNGILNMLATVQKNFKNVPIKAVIGGFHLAQRPGRPGIAGKREDIAFIAHELLRYGVEKVVTGHCTGRDAGMILHEEMGEKLTIFSTGYSCNL